MVREVHFKEHLPELCLVLLANDPTGLPKNPKCLRLSSFGTTESPNFPTDHPPKKYFPNVPGKLIFVPLRTFLPVLQGILGVVNEEKAWLNSVDGRNPANQLIGSLSDYPIIYRVLAPSQVVVWDSFHQQSYFTRFA